MLTALDHVNLHTADLEEMAKWYEDILGLKPGPRPNLSVPGIWMYLGDTAVVHLVQFDGPLTQAAVSLEHFAFRATGMDAFVQKLNDHGIPFDQQPVPGTDIVQFNLRDPMGTHLHIDFREGAPGD